MGVYELIAEAIDNSLTGNICTPFEGCGMAELMSDGTQTFPVTSDRSHKKIMPSQVSRLKMYHRYAGPEERGESDDGDSFGLQVNSPFTREIYLVGVGLSALIHKDCALNDSDLAQSVADQFPTEVEPTTTVNNVQIRITSIETDKAAIASAEWDGVEMGNRFPNLSLFKITYEVSGNYCVDSCGGDTVNICADVTVIDTDQSVNNVPSGGTFTCTPRIPLVNAVVWANFEDTLEVDGYGAILAAQAYNNHSLQKDFTASAGLNAGASSNQIVTAVKGTLSMDAFESVIIGLNFGAPAFIASPGLSDVQHGFYFQSGNQGKIDLYESGANVNAGSVSFPVTGVRNLRTDMEWEVRFSAGKIQYYWNGLLDKTSAVPYNPGDTFHVYAVLFQPGGKITTVQWTL